MLPINTNLLWLILGTLAALAIGSAVRLFALRNSAADVAKQRIGSLKVWWLLVVLWSTVAVFGQVSAAVLLAVASFLGMREFLKMIGTVTEIGRPAIASLFVCGIIHYGLIVAGGTDTALAKVFLPITLLLILSVVRSTLATMQNYMRITASLYWGAMLIVYGPSHALFLFHISPDEQPPIVGTAGWFLFLVLLTEMNDIMQALIGRKLGARKITPILSPHKTIEGLVGGMVSTILLSVILAPWLTTLGVDKSFILGISLSVFAGVLISLSGFLGDINMSAIKRDAGVKDGSKLLPGMGGVIDRIDSLTFTAPVFYYFVATVN